VEWLEGLGANRGAAGDRTPFASVTRYKKESFSVVAEPELIARIAAENDVALIGIGD